VAQAELAIACAWQSFLFAPEDKQWQEKAFVAVEKALSLDPDLAEAHLARGRLLWTPANHFPHEAALREFRRALASNPNLDEAHHQLALIYIHIGLLDKAQVEAQNAVAINPSNTPARYRVGEAMLFQARYNEALTVFEGTPKGFNPSVKGSETAWALFQLGRRQEAAAKIDESLKSHPEDTAGAFAGMQAILLAAAGNTREAERKIQDAAAKRAYGHFHHTAYNLGSAYAILNRPHEAVRWLQIAVETGFACYPMFERDPNLNPIRADTEFLALMARLKHQWEIYKATL